MAVVTRTYFGDALMIEVVPVEAACFLRPRDMKLAAREIRAGEGVDVSSCPGRCFLSIVFSACAPEWTLCPFVWEASIK